MTKSLKKPLSILFGALATTALGGCYYGDVHGASYASAGVCSDRYYDYDPYAYDDGYGYDCYDPTDYSGGFVQIGFGGGWYDRYYYPGYGLWMFDNYRNRYPLRGHYLSYWGGRRAWWKHHRDDRGDWRRDGHWRDRERDGRPDRPGRPGRPGGWDGRGDRDGTPGTRPSPRPGRGTPPAAENPARPDRPGAIPGRRPGRDVIEGGRPPRETIGGDQFERPRRPIGAPRRDRDPDFARPAPLTPPAMSRPTAPSRPPSAAPTPRPAPAVRPAPAPRPATERNTSRRIERMRED
ncbi:MAG: hypothetical protein U0S50_16935 [Sphingopyxis sp.]|uniref:hypothetical protein n=1 Tax=Sphingopyxis sp. TaxID=1908224 RepID=UPI002ABCD59C|nr:hypothetical protein [Sphingopyxis sp.]MDZ3833480.1 hypothetical protein [Sphingopyxis sp.]